MFFRRDNNVIPGNDKPLINNIVILKPRSKSTLELAVLEPFSTVRTNILHNKIILYRQILCAMFHPDILIAHTHHLRYIKLQNRSHKIVVCAPFQSLFSKVTTNPRPNMFIQCVCIAILPT